MRRYRVVTAVVVVAGLGLLCGCSGSSAKKASAFGGTSGAASEAAPAAGSAAGLAPGRVQAASAASAASVTGPAERSVVVTATVSLVAAKVDDVADKVDALAVKNGGRIDGDQRSSVGSDRTATLTLRVLPARIDAVISAVDTLGNERARTLRRDDVTTSKADIDARVATLSTSVTRLRHLLGTAIGVATLLQVEKVLTARESDLSSLRATQRALDDQVSLAALTVTITAKAKPKPTVVVHHHHFRATGFLAAVDSSVHGLGVTATVVIAAVGYVLPVLLPIGLVAALVLGVRRRRRGASGPVDEPAAT